MSRAEPGTVLEILAAATAWLERRGVDAPRRSVELLMGHVLGLDRLRLYLQHDRPLTPGEKDRLRALVARRGEHEPVAYLIGTWEFHGHELAVDRRVLVPRPETEGLVTLALELLPEDARRVVDLGTGSGAIAIAIAHAQPELEVWAVDASEAALAVAAENVARHGLAARVHVRRGSWWEGVEDGVPFDLAVGNPPYVDPARQDLVEEGVRRFEPGAALWTPPGDPAAPYRAIASGALAALRGGAPLVLETGVGAAEPGAAALAVAGLTDVATHEDLAGIPRYLVARTPVATTRAAP